MKNIVKIKLACYLQSSGHVVLNCSATLKIKCKTYLGDLLMKMKKLVAATAMLSGLVGFAVPAAHAEVAATLGLSNMYYWRGFDLQGGAAATADIKYSESGFYAGAWTSSGDATNGTEYDLYSGYAVTAGDFKADLSLVSYNYPAPKVNSADSEAKPIPLAPGDYTEAVLALSYGPVTATYYKAISAKKGNLSDNEYSYATLALTLDKFSFKYGEHFEDNKGTVSHLDATYAYNDKLAFTLGKIIDDNDGAVPSEVNFVVALTLPIQ